MSYTNIFFLFERSDYLSPNELNPSYRGEREVNAQSRPGAARWGARRGGSKPQPSSRSAFDSSPIKPRRFTPEQREAPGGSGDSPRSVNYYELSQLFKPSARDQLSVSTFGYAFACDFSFINAVVRGGGFCCSILVLDRLSRLNRASQQMFFSFYIFQRFPFRTVTEKTGIGPAGLLERRSFFAVRSSDRILDCRETVRKIRSS